MARVCVGCGLTTNDDGELIADVNDSVWVPATLGVESSCAAPVYCTDSGGLHVGPRAKSSVFNKEALFNLGSNGIEGLSDELELSGTITATIPNPSNCLRAVVLVNITVDFDLNTPVGARVRMYQNGDQFFDWTNRGSAQINGMGYNLQIPYNAQSIAAGGNLSVSIPITMSSVGANSTLTKFQYHINAIIIAADA